MKEMKEMKEMTEMMAVENTMKIEESAAVLTMMSPNILLRKKWLNPRRGFHALL